MQASLKGEGGALFGPALACLQRVSLFLDRSLKVGIDPRSAEQVAATQLSAAGTVKWALKLQSSAGKSVRLEAESRALALRSLLEGSERLLGKVPACSQEQDYRHALGKLSQQMAG